MAWRTYCKEKLPEHLDERGDLAPPWEKFPEYESLTIGWRMGPGETWLGLWHAFLDQLAPDRETRRDYLRRHPPAPYTWAHAVLDVLHPSDPEDEDEREVTPSIARELIDEGFLQSDVSFQIWRAAHQEVRWPWQWRESPEAAARYRTRDLWFWSRQVADLRAQGGELAFEFENVPADWQEFAALVRGGALGPIDAGRGLRCLSMFLAKGEMRAPWQLGLDPSSFASTFEDDMGYADAFRLWAMSAFDDAPHFERTIEPMGIPEAWRRWVDEELRSMLPENGWDEAARADD